ncbi:MAG: hypothetical protein JRG91_17190 [Deltaproteobacteria bacterium]|nr:hypothetical protein [Deltaproteobacteria bacterium]
MGRLLSRLFLVAVLLASCARASDDDYSDGWPDSVPDGTWDAADVLDVAQEEPEEPPSDFLDAPDAPDALDAAGDASDPAEDSSDPGPDPDADPDPDPDPPPDTIDGPCSGTSHAGCCWYLGGGSYPSCTTVCSSHGGYNACTRSFAGSDGTSSNCDAVLTALSIPSPGTTSTLIASGSGVGCFYMDVAGSRYWVRDSPTTEGATYMLARRACACNN